MRFQNERVQTFRALVKTGSHAHCALAQGTQLSLSTAPCIRQAAFCYLDGKTGKTVSQKDIKGTLNLPQVLSFISSSARSFSLQLSKSIVFAGQPRNN